MSKVTPKKEEARREEGLWLIGNVADGGQSVVVPHGLGKVPSQVLPIKAIGGDGRLACVRATDRELEFHNSSATTVTFDLYVS